MNAVFVFFLKELATTFRDFFSKLIDSLVWALVVVAVAGYILPLIGFNATYGPFILVGQMVSNALVRGWTQAFGVLNGIHGTRQVLYSLSLPIKRRNIFLMLILANALYSGVNNLFFLFAGKLILGDIFSFSRIEVVPAALVYSIIHFFASVFGLWLAAVSRHMDRLEQTWMRFVMPLLFLGCMQFPWWILYERHEKIAYAVLLNPFTYAMEGVRSAFGVDERALPWVYCCVVLIGGIVFLFSDASRRLRRQLDLI